MLGRVRQVIDQNYENYRPYYSDYNTFALKVQSLQVPYGKIQVQSNVQIVWKLSI